MSKVQDNKYYEAIDFCTGSKCSIPRVIVEDALEYIFSILSTKNPLVEKYKTAKTVLELFKQKLLYPQQTICISKADLKITIDVITEIKNNMSITDLEKIDNEKLAFFCKIMVDCM